jgi:hypothetical protein
MTCEFLLSLEQHCCWQVKNFENVFGCSEILNRVTKTRPYWIPTVCSLNFISKNAQIAVKIVNSFEKSVIFFTFTQTMVCFGSEFEQVTALCSVLILNIARCRTSCFVTLPDDLLSSFALEETITCLTVRELGGKQKATIDGIVENRTARLPKML